MKRILSVLCLIVLFAALMPQAASAAEPHEDPAAAKLIYSHLSLLLYYSGSLDPILDRDPASTETILSKLPFANIPPALDQPTQDFASSGIDFSVSLTDLFSIWQQENSLISEYRLDEAAGLGKQITDGLPQARNQLARLKESVQDTGIFMKISALNPSNQVFLTYQEIMDKINRLEQMLDLLSRPLLDIEKLTELLQSTNPDLLQQILASGNPDLLKDLLKPTGLTLEVNPQSAFVGDEVDFSGLLSSQGMPLAERNIDLLLDNTLYLTIKTDAQGHFQGKLQVPYRYQPEMEVQAIYYPRNADTGVYLGSASPLTMLKILYYKANLVLQIKGSAYPGKVALLAGQYDYGLSPAPTDRQSSLYLDDILVSELITGVDFDQKISLDTGLSLGKHSITIAAPAQGRYSSVVGNCVLDAIQAGTILDLSTPGLAFIPGSMAAGGQLHSDLGPLHNALIDIEMNGTLTQINSAADGSFVQQIKMGMAWSLLGSQNIEIRIQPREPWNAPLSLTRSVFVINYLNCGLLLLVLLALVFSLSRRFKKWSAVHPQRLKESPESALPGLVSQAKPPVYVQSLKASNPSSESSDPLFGGYRLALKLIQSLTRVILKPQQTLREYALENSPKLGPLGKYFLEFTFLIERFLYSNHQPAGEDIANSRRLAESIQEEAKHENL